MYWTLRMERRLIMVQMQNNAIVATLTPACRTPRRQLTYCISLIRKERTCSRSNRISCLKSRIPQSCHRSQSRRHTKEAYRTEYIVCSQSSASFAQPSLALQLSAPCSYRSEDLHSPNRPLTQEQQADRRLKSRYSMSIQLAAGGLQTITAILSGNTSVGRCLRPV